MWGPDVSDRKERRRCCPLMRETYSDGAPRVRGPTRPGGRGMAWEGGVGWCGQVWSAGPDPGDSNFK
jgi:hypothetical protein